ncbi:hypothetical protein TWF106_010994 [Orbilia oligospora]|uniref:Uncharacterized protein n=1 Tax=Orbilia oligospora TaxID=2813651 RepID=A0A6G1MDY4_ORBOL|nr:hypothetical protein TWF106_010994 [Orbilia oligospora]KAF3210715.1 hypothetical protein TWF191_011096 [Orbilia oligospora]KAF3215449.1 hypothetical protein TWF679_003968 [Orbilia oligospora]KAF3255297.1 hypothetical protein TWF192_002655 [Orbilia oligospora]
MSPLPSSTDSKMESPPSPNCTYTSLLESCRQTNQPPPLEHGTIAAAIAAVSVIMFLIFLGFYLFFRARKKNTKNRNRISSGSESGDPSRRYIPPLLQFSTGNNRASAASASRSHTPGLEPLLDDHTLAKQFNELDGKITDHVINYWHSGEISSRDYQTYINSDSSRQSWNKILFQGRPLLVNFGARVHMFRAILAYHVYSCIADWKILTNEQQVAIVRDGTIRNSVRRKICSSLRSSEQDKMRRVEIIFNILEKETRLHVSNENRYDDLHKESLENISESVVNIGIQLGSQKDDFRFEFRNKDIDGGIRDNPLAVSLLGEPGANSETVEVVNEMGGTIRALVSPGVIRVPNSKNREEYFVRKTLVFTA